MSKSPNFLIPALGGAGLILGVAYGFASRDYGADKIELLENRVAQAEAQISAASEKAAAAADRASQLEQEVAEVQAVAAERAASGASLTAPAPKPETARQAEPAACRW